MSNVSDVLPHFQRGVGAGSLSGTISTGPGTIFTIDVGRSDWKGGFITIRGDTPVSAASLGGFRGVRCRIRTNESEGAMVGECLMEYSAVFYTTSTSGIASNGITGSFAYVSNTYFSGTNINVLGRLFSGSPQAVTWDYSYEIWR